MTVQNVHGYYHCKDTRLYKVLATTQHTTKNKCQLKIKWSKDNKPLVTHI